MQVIVLIGPPLAGKGTQSDYLIAGGYAHFSAGEHLRARAGVADDTGRDIAAILRGGGLVSDRIINMIAGEALLRAREDGARGLVLDGFPRTLGQAEFLDQRLRRDGLQPIIVELVVDDESVLDRRREKRLRDAFNAHVEPRSDDQPDVFQRRLATYHEQSALLGPHYAARGCLHRLDGLAEAAQVHKQICAIVSAGGRASSYRNPAGVRLG